MATVCKLNRTTAQAIVPQTWTLLTYDAAPRNDLGMEQDLSLIVPAYDGDFLWTVTIRWDAITVPGGDTRRRKFEFRFVRDPLGTPDPVARHDRLATPGDNWETATFLFRGRARQPVGMALWHDHTSDVTISRAQFAAYTWDYSPVPGDPATVGFASGYTRDETE